MLVTPVKQFIDSIELWGGRIMVKYNLQPNEFVVLKSDRVLHGGVRAVYTDELILTNLNVVLISKGFFNNTKNIQTYPVNQIKVFDGQAQAKLGKQRSGYPQLEIYFLNDQEAFGFEQKKEVLNWIDNISKLLTGKSANIVPGGRAAIPGTEFIAETLKSTLDTFKGAFGIQLKKSDKEIEPKKVTKKCISCMAPISGYIGQSVRCKYCDTEQNL